jgi:hypothetical protein
VAQHIAVSVDLNGHDPPRLISGHSIGTDCELLNCGPSFAPGLTATEAIR